MSDPLRILEQRQRRDVRLLYSVLSDSLANTLDRQLRGQNGGRPITEVDRRAIMRHVDRGLAVIYGPQKGIDGALTEIVVRDARAARFEPLDTAVSTWKKAMGRTLGERVESEARRD